jgi:hypothetical protein
VRGLLFQEEVLLSCKRCSTKVPKSSVKYNSTGEFLICSPCYAKEHGGEIKSETKQRVYDPIATNLERVDYECTSCGYNYSRKAGLSFALSCPYCSRNSVKRKGYDPAKDEELSQEPGLFWNVDKLFDEE